MYILVANIFTTIFRLGIWLTVLKNSSSATDSDRERERMLTTHPPVLHMRSDEDETPRRRSTKTA
jgi:hypothetical protein